jgi:hypothetical protein
LLGYISKNAFVKISFDSRTGFDHKFLRLNAMYVGTDLQLAYRKKIKIEKGSFIIFIVSFGNFASLYGSKASAGFNIKGNVF